MGGGQLRPHEVMCLSWTCLGLLGLGGHSLQQGQQGSHASHTSHHILGEGLAVGRQLPATSRPTPPQMTFQSGKLGPGDSGSLERTSPTDLAGHSVAPQPTLHSRVPMLVPPAPLARARVHTHLHIPGLHPVARQAAIQPMARGQVQADVVPTGLGAGRGREAGSVRSGGGTGVGGQGNIAGLSQLPPTQYLR